MSCRLKFRGETEIVQCGHITAVAWLDNKEYSDFSPIYHTVVQRKDMTGSQLDVPCPLRTTCTWVRGYYHYYIVSTIFATVTPAGKQYPIRDRKPQTLFEPTWYIYT